MARPAAARTSGEKCDERMGDDDPRSTSGTLTGNRIANQPTGKPPSAGAESVASAGASPKPARPTARAAAPMPDPTTGTERLLNEMTAKLRSLRDSAPRGGIPEGSRTFAVLKVIHADGTAGRSYEGSFLGGEKHAEELAWEKAKRDIRPGDTLFWMIDQVPCPDRCTPLLNDIPEAYRVSQRVLVYAYETGKTSIKDGVEYNVAGSAKTQATRRERRSIQHEPSPTWVDMNEFRRIRPSYTDGSHLPPSVRPADTISPNRGTGTTSLRERGAATAPGAPSGQPTKPFEGRQPSPPKENPRALKSPPTDTVARVPQTPPEARGTDHKQRATSDPLTAQKGAQPEPVIQAAEARAGAAEGAAVLLNSMVASYLTDQVNVQAESELQQIIRDVHALQASGKWIVVWVGVAMPKLRDVLTQVTGVYEADQIPTFIGLQYTYGATAQEASVLLANRRGGVFNSQGRPVEWKLWKTYQPFIGRRSAVADAVAPRGREAAGATPGIHIDNSKAFEERTQGRKAIDIYESLRDSRMGLNSEFEVRLGGERLLVDIGLRVLLLANYRRRVITQISERAGHLRWSIEEQQDHLTAALHEGAKLNPHILDDARAHLSSVKDAVMQQRFRDALESIDKGFEVVDSVWRVLYKSRWGSEPPI